MVVLPAASVVAKPAVLMVATVVLVELQVTVLVRFWVLLSLYVPVAVNCCGVPKDTVAEAGETVMETSGGGGGRTVTVCEVDELKPRLSVRLNFTAKAPAVL